MIKISMDVGVIQWGEEGLWRRSG